ncbi:MAG: NAD-dependent epimerase/dehydratase family protein [Mariprofundaceae bacterium]
MKILLTGASGFVGSAVLRHLLAVGHDVRVLVRPQSDLRNIAELPVEFAQGDLTDTASLSRAVQGCAGLFHVAADYRLWVPDAQTMLTTNIDGTRNLMLAALEAGVERVVYTSSVATLGHKLDATPADEDTPSQITDMIGPYKHSKFLAEQEVQRLISGANLPAIIVHPSTPIGPRDIKPTPTGRMIVDAACGRMPAYVDTGLNIVHVDDVAVGHVLAFEHGKIGRHYILGGENMSLKSILGVVAEINGRSPPKLCLPHSLVLPLAYVAEVFARLSGNREPFFTVDGVRMAENYMFYTSARAESEIGYQPRPAQNAMRDAIAWFREHGYCP